MNKTFELLGILGTLILPGEYNLMSVAQWPAHGKLQIHNKILSNIFQITDVLFALLLVSTINENGGY